MRYAKLWIGLAVVIVVSFTVLGYYGGEIYRQAPPVPERVVITEGTVLFTSQDIKDGQNVWQSLGGQEVGSVWGHGAYVAPDWSADWLHREATWLFDHWAHEGYGKTYAQLDEGTQASLPVTLKRELRTNTYQPTTGDLLVSPLRAEAIAAVGAHYAALFGNDPELAARRVWRTGALSFVFWAINAGLALMVLLSLLPVGLLQTWASVEHGLWYARSAEFLQTDLMNTLRWLRVIGDTIFAAGVLALGWFVLGLKTGWSLTNEPQSLGVPVYKTSPQVGRQ